MKCPKCEYLGFETGERCRNCGYDFSLMAVPDANVPDLALRIHADEGPAEWPDELDIALGDRGEAPRQPFPRLSGSRLAAAATLTPAAPAAPPAPAAPAPAAPSASTAAAMAPGSERTSPSASVRGDPALPLFAPGALSDDEPLIKVPAQPRAPLAVRRTPESPRLRALAKPIERAPAEPELDFVAPDEPQPSRSATAVSASLATSDAGARIMAAAIDHAILFAIDGVVVYLTLRVAALTMSDWVQLPFLPMGAFLGLLKLAYFTAFTCVGGQTIGKMAAGIRVVGDHDRSLDAPQSIHRALAGAVSFLTLGLGFVPALVGADHRALHDRLAHTRVVALPRA